MAFHPRPRQTVQIQDIEGKNPTSALDVLQSECSKVEYLRPRTVVLFNAVPAIWENDKVSVSSFSGISMPFRRIEFIQHRQNGKRAQSETRTPSKNSISLLVDHGKAGLCARGTVDILREILTKPELGT